MGRFTASRNCNCKGVATLSIVWNILSLSELDGKIDATNDDPFRLIIGIEAGVKQRYVSSY
jgi:hypothetical protein